MTFLPAEMPLLTELESVWAADYNDVAPTALGKIALVAGAGGVILATQ
jgi:hypothetical protein